MTQRPTSAFHATRMQDLVALTAFLDRICREAGAGEETVFAVRLAVEEVFTNIIHYGYGNQAGPITISVDAEPARITVTIEDAAPRFDITAVPVPDLDATWDERKIGGLGWHFVHQLMDEVKREPGAERGNVFTLVKSFQGSHPRRKY